MNNPWKEINPPVKDVSAVRISATHPLDLYWAKDHVGHYLFIYEFPSIVDVFVKDPPELENVEVISTITKNQTSRLILKLVNKESWELFSALCCDLIVATNNIESPKVASNTILRRLIRWSEFLKKKRSDILPEEKIKGLIGELLFIKNHLSSKFTYTESIDFWIGPDGAPQDFNVNNFAIEVKCQLGGSNPSVKISSENQLCTQLSRLTLYVVTLGKSTIENGDSINLPTLITQINEHLIAGSNSFSIFQNKLMEIGYFSSDKYLDYNYIVSDERMYDVKDDFPRICPNDLLNGIIKVNYCISINDCKPYEIEIKDINFNND